MLHASKNCSTTQTLSKSRTAEAWGGVYEDALWAVAALLGCRARDRPDEHRLGLDQGPWCCVLTQGTFQIRVLDAKRASAAILRFCSLMPHLAKHVVHANQ